jgi:7,8-dihydropterin-6-yl-methyl-4-(beta-D-ribofuranosyl)aminobenzene 5'-phosphate synthase
MPLVIHPDAWLERRVVLPTGAELHLPPPNRADLEREDVEILAVRDGRHFMGAQITGRST